MSTGTAPAWQVREMQRQKLLFAVKQKIISRESGLAKHNLFNLYWTFSFLLYSQLQRSDKGISYDDLSRSGWANERVASLLFCEVLNEVEGFQRSKEEGHALLAELFEWSASQVASPYRSALRAQELYQPKLIYGIEDRTKEVPFE